MAVGSQLAPSYVGQIRVRARIGAIFYRLEIPEALTYVHEVFHVTWLCRHFRDEERQQIIFLSDFDL
jgi:hypothetical protein